MGPVEYTLTPKELAQAYRLHYRRAFLGVRAILLPFAVALVAYGIATVLSAEASEQYSVGRFAAVLAVAYVVVFAAVFALTWYVTLPMSARRQFKQRKEFATPLSIDVQSPFIAMTSGYGFAKIPTEDMVKWTEDRRVLLLYRTDRTFNMVPKRVVTDALDAALKAELARAGVRKIGSRKTAAAT